MKTRFIIAALVAIFSCGPAAADTYLELGDQPFGKKLDEVKTSLSGQSEVINACTSAALRSLYGANGVSCDALISHTPVKIGSIQFYPEYAVSRWGERVVAVIYRSAYSFVSKGKRDLEMGAEDLVAAAADRDYMLARNSTFRALGDVATMVGRQQLTQQPGRRVVKYYFVDEKQLMVFREHTTEREERITLVALPKNSGDERRVFLSEKEDRRFFGSGD